MNFLKLILFCLFFFLFFLNPLSKVYSQISLAPFQTYHISSYAKVVRIGDVNNDGLNDVVLGASYVTDPVNDNKIYVYIQNNQGQLLPPVKYSYNAPNYAEVVNTIAIADLNNDGLNDIVIGYADSIGIYFQNNSGTLNPIQTYFSGVVGDAMVGYRLSLIVGDLNHDGLMDIVIGHDGQAVISVLCQIEGGGFNTILIPFGGGTIKVIDYNCNQLNELILFKSFGLGILSPDNSGVFTNYQFYSNPIELHQDAMDVGDLNNDGWPDVVQTGEYAINSYIHSKVTLFFQNPTTHQFQDTMKMLAESNAETVKIADLNNDCRNEIIIASTGYVQVFEQNSNNIYHSYDSFPNPYSTHYNRQALDIGDINNDGKKDIVVANFSEGLVVYLNQSVSYGPCCNLPAKPGLPQGDSVICSNQIISKYKSNLCNCDSSQWHLIPPESGNIIYSNTDSCQIEWTDNWQGDAHICVTSVNSCGTRTSDTLHVIFSNLSLLNLGNDTILCSNSTINLNPDGNFTSFLWQDNSTSPVYTVTHGGTYFVEAGNACGNRSDTIVITEIPLPIVNLISDTVLCSGTSIQFNVAIPGNYTYLWQDNSTSPSYTVTNSGIYTVTITNSDNCKASKSVNVSPITVPDIHLPEDSTFCGEINLTLNVTETGCTYIWQDNSTNPYYQVLQAGIYNVTVTNICGATTDSANVILVPFPAINLPADTSFCTGNTISINITQPAGYSYNYLWQDNSTNPIYTISQPGNYSIHVSYSTLCHSDHVITVQELSIPSINLENNISFCKGESYMLDASYPGGKYLWQDGDTSSLYTVHESGQYSVTITNVCGATYKTVSALVQDCSVYLDVPSAFSPNADGNNDILFAVGRNVIDISFIIYDRWGEKVFESNDLLKGWDGTFQGKQLNAAVFIYYISATSTSDGHKIEKQGNISLVK